MAQAQGMWIGFETESLPRASGNIIPMARAGVASSRNMMGSFTAGDQAMVSLTTGISSRA